LSRTFSHGISACFWNTTPRSAPGPTTGRPSSRISPARRRQEAGDAVQQGRLAAARCAERDDEVAIADRQVDRGERLQRAALDRVVDGQVADGRASAWRGAGEAGYLPIAFCR
jgi:hypothetical protein